MLVWSHEAVVADDRFETWEGCLLDVVVVCVSLEGVGLWHVGQPEEGALYGSHYYADDVLAEGFADLEVARLAAEKWAATHVPVCAEALLREAERHLRVLLNPAPEPYFDDPDNTIACEHRDWMSAATAAAEFHARLAALLGGTP